MQLLIILLCRSVFPLTIIKRFLKFNEQISAMNNNTLSYYSLDYDIFEGSNECFHYSTYLPRSQFLQRMIVQKNLSHTAIE